MNSSFFSNNRSRLYSQLSNNSLMILYSGRSIPKSADELYPFHANRNFYYLTGIEQENVYLLVHQQNGVVRERLFIDPVDPDKEKWTGKMLSFKDASTVSGIEVVESMHQFPDILGRMLREHDYQHAYFDLWHYNYDDPISLTHQVAHDFHTKHPHIGIQDIYSEICELRTQKSDEEIALTRMAIEITNQGIQAMLRHAKPGVTEYELEAQFEFVAKSSGGKMAYPPIVARGKNATIMHYITNRERVEDGELVLVDIGAEFASYKADITRTFPVNGRFTSRQKEIYNIVLQALLETTECVKPGVKHELLDQTTRRVLADGLKRLNVIQEDSELSRYYFYNVSHYLGIDTHDVGKYNILRPGMILTIEPGLYLPQESIGVRLEDNILVTETGYENLSQDIVRSVEDIESLMNKHSKN